MLWWQFPVHLIDRLLVRGQGGVSLIVKTTTNPFFVAMEDGAKKAAEAGGVDLKLAAARLTATRTARSRPSRPPSPR